MTKSSLSVVVSCYNSATTLKDCLQSISQSDLPHIEIIAVDDASQDNSPQIAKTYAHKVIVNPHHLGRTPTRQLGFLNASSDIVVNIDSDVVIKPSTLSQIHQYFNHHPETKAVTGMLEKTTPHQNFSSQYKNLYMHYHFSLLPLEVNFIYGSIFAFHSHLLSLFQPQQPLGEDTEFGQILQEHHHPIHLPPFLQVTHLKRYSVTSLIKNDFLIPFNWAQILWIRRGWKQIGRNSTGLAHASFSQIISLFIAPTTTLSLLFFPKILTSILFITWFTLNLPFHFFLLKEKNLWFSSRSFVFTFFDQHVMLSGILLGSILSYCRLLFPSTPSSSNL